MKYLSRPLAFYSASFVDTKAIFNFASKQHNRLNSPLLKIALLLVLIIGDGLAEPKNAIAQTAYIQEVSGKVELKRKTWSDFHFITRPGTPLFVGDQLRRASDATAIIACPNGQKQPVRRAEERTSLTEICVQWKGIISKGPPPSGSLGGTNLQIPFLIAPRRTLLLNRTPTLRWNPVPGVTHYDVQILDAGRVVWQTQVQEPQVIYPGKPVLKPGIRYSVVIQTNTGVSSQTEAATNHEFILLQEAEAKVAQAALNTILQSGLTQEIKALKLANYYSNYEISQPAAYGLTDKEAKGYRLNAEAIAVIEELLANKTQSPLIYRTLGNLYWQAGLMKLAEKAYLNAIDQVQSVEDLEEWAFAMVGLGELYEATQNPQQALLWYRQAKAGFTLLSDQQAEALTRRIERLKRTIANLLPPR